MEKQINLYKEAEALCEELKSSNKVTDAIREKFKKLLKEFFANPSQKCGFTSAIIWQKLNWAFQNYFEKHYGNEDIDDLSEIVLQCRIDCFFAELIELYDLNMAEEILESTTKIHLSDEIEDILDEAWDEVERISAEIGEYLVKYQIKCDNMVQTTVGVKKYAHSKFIDHPDIPEHEGLWIRVRIVVDENDKVSVYAIIVPQEKGGAAILYDITSVCQEWIDML